MYSLSLCVCVCVCVLCVCVLCVYVNFIIFQRLSIGFYVVDFELSRTIKHDVTLCTQDVVLAPVPLENLKVALEENQEKGVFQDG